MKKANLEQPARKSKLNSFNGIFVPTFLSIIGVILFLRLGLIVGSAGLLPTIAIILLASSVTFATGLSISSITTNMRISAGGAYSIISKTLGLEVGGSVGLPLYLAQIFSVTLYLFGLSEAWSFIFPQHSKQVVLLISFALLFILTYISTKLAVRAQIVTFVFILIALIAIFLSTTWLKSPVSISVIGSFETLSFWKLFALFFPAVTGILAGMGMSGELEDPKKQIPKGMITAIISSIMIYILVAIFLAFSASKNALISDNLILVKLAFYENWVLIGIIMSTFSSALTTFISAPRLLQAMAEKALFPGSIPVSKKNDRGIPKLAVFITSIPIIITLLFFNLDAVAPLITVFFLVTYVIINSVVFIEQSIGLVSFRPTLKIPILVPLYGALASMIFMFLINALAGIIAITFVFISYLYLAKRKLVSKEGDIRSGLFITFSEWAARKVLTLPESTKHTWKPNILLPVISTRTLLGNFPIIKSITFPNGTMTVLGLDIKDIKSSPEVLKSTKKKIKSENKDLPKLVKKFGNEGIFTSSSTVKANDYFDAITISLEAIEGQSFSPNILFLPFKPNKLPLAKLKSLIKIAKEHDVGLILSDRDEEVGLGSEEDIHVWLPSSALKNDLFEDKGFDLSLLISYRLFRNWAGTINIWMCVKKEKAIEAEHYVKKMLYEARFPSSTVINISTDSFSNTLDKSPKGDIHLLPLQGVKDIAKAIKLSKQEERSFLFLIDSGKEDILA